MLSRDEHGFVKRLEEECEIPFDFTRPNQKFESFDDIKEKTLDNLQRKADDFLGYQTSQSIYLDNEEIQSMCMMMINNIGDAYSEAPYRCSTKPHERAAINWFSKLLSAPVPAPLSESAYTHYHPDRAWGHVLSMGCTEGNMYGLRNARDYLQGKYASINQEQLDVIHNVMLERQLYSINKSNIDNNDNDTLRTARRNSLLGLSRPHRQLDSDLNHEGMPFTLAPSEIAHGHLRDKIILSTNQGIPLTDSVEDTFNQHWEENSKNHNSLYDPNLVNSMHMILHEPPTNTITPAKNTKTKKAVNKRGKKGSKKVDVVDDEDNNNNDDDANNEENPSNDHDTTSTNTKTHCDVSMMSPAASLLAQPGNHTRHSYQYLTTEQVEEIARLQEANKANEILESQKRQTGRKPATSTARQGGRRGAASTRKTANTRRTARSRSRRGESDDDDESDHDNNDTMNDHENDNKDVVQDIEVLVDHPREPVLVYSTASHYSISKIKDTLLILSPHDASVKYGYTYIPTVRLTDDKNQEDTTHEEGEPIPLPEKIQTHKDGTTDLDHFLSICRVLVQHNHPLIIVANYGTTFTGAYDRPHDMYDLLEKNGLLREMRWVHNPTQPADHLHRLPSLSSSSSSSSKATSNRGRSTSRSRNSKNQQQDNGNNNIVQAVHGVYYRPNIWIHVDAALGGPYGSLFAPTIDEDVDLGKHYLVDHGTNEGHSAQDNTIRLAGYNHNQIPSLRKEWSKQFNIPIENIPTLPVMDFRRNKTAVPGRQRFGPIMSIAMSGHKILGSPFPTGLFMTLHRYLLDFSVISYIGSADTTLAGSRNGMSAYIMWKHTAIKSICDFAHMFITCEANAQYTENKMIQIYGREHVYRAPYSLAVIIPQPPREIVDEFSLSTDMYAFPTVGRINNKRNRNDDDDDDDENINRTNTNNTSTQLYKHAQPDDSTCIDVIHIFHMPSATRPKIDKLYQRLIEMGVSEENLHGRTSSTSRSSSTTSSQHTNTNTKRLRNDDLENDDNDDVMAPTNDQSDEHQHRRQRTNTYDSNLNEDDANTTHNTDVSTTKTSVAGSTTVPIVQLDQHAPRRGPGMTSPPHPHHDLNNDDIRTDTTSIDTPNDVIYAISGSGMIQHGLAATRINNNNNMNTTTNNNLLSQDTAMSHVPSTSTSTSHLQRNDHHNPQQLQRLSVEAALMKNEDDLTHVHETDTLDQHHHYTNQSITKQTTPYNLDREHESKEI